MFGKFVAACVPELGVFSLVDRPSPRQDRCHLGLDRVATAIRAQRRVRLHLGPIDCHHPQVHQPRLRAQPQHLTKQHLNHLLMTLTEPCDRHVIRQVTRADHPERDILMTRPLDTTTRMHSLAIRVDQQRQHHRRVIRCPAHPTQPIPILQHRQIQRIDHPQHEPHQMIRWQPLGHVRRQQEPLVPNDLQETTRHNPRS